MNEDCGVGGVSCTGIGCCSCDEDDEDEDEGCESGCWRVG